MTTEAAIKEGQLLAGPVFSEPMRVEAMHPNGPAFWTTGHMDQQSEQFPGVTLMVDGILNWTIAGSTLSTNVEAGLKSAVYWTGDASCQFPE